MVTIYWTDEARSRLKSIYKYIARDNKIDAINVAKRIREKAQLLKRFPRIGAIYPDITDREVRIIYFTHYRIVYMIVNDERIDILGVFHGAMELRKYLR
jgi:toxin ParE1/3/4